MENKRPAVVFHPGEYLVDELNERGWSQIEFAEIISRPVRTVNEIINGKRGVSPDSAREIGAALGTSAELWMNLDTAYNLWKSNRDITPIKQRAKIYSNFPFRDMVRRSWIQQSEDAQIEESQILRFFEISSLDEYPQLATDAAFKRSDSREDVHTQKQIAWIYRVKHIANSMIVPKFSKSKLVKAVEIFKTFREAPEEIRHIPGLLESCGVRFIIVESLPSSKIDGVCMWLDDVSPVIGLTLRYDRIDNFWFVLRHEIEHVLNRDGSDSIIIDSNIFENIEETNLSLREQEANKIASEFCVPQSKLEDFLARKGKYVSNADISNFSESLQIHPGLVVGQIQWKTKRYKKFRSKLISIKKFITPVTMTDGFGYEVPINV